MFRESQGPFNRLLRRDKTAIYKKDVFMCHHSLHCRFGIEAMRKGVIDNDSSCGKLSHVENPGHIGRADNQSALVDFRWNGPGCQDHVDCSLISESRSNFLGQLFQFYSLGGNIAEDEPLWDQFAVKH